MKDIPTSKSIELWILKKCGSETTRTRYLRRSELFFEWANIEPDKVIEAWKQVKYSNDLGARERFIDEWTEKIELYVYKVLKDLAPLTRLNELACLQSFFKAHKIPVEPQKQRYAFVKYHNRDITKQEIRRILEHSQIRNRAFFLFMAESGLRPYTMVQLRYKHIKKDFEVDKVPMKIELPSELLKDRVEPRWTFIGEDAFKTLKEYLTPRLPLDNEDLIFAPKRSDTKHSFLLPGTFTNIFGTTATKLGIAESRGGKPRNVRLYCLRKFFNEHMRYEGFNTAYREFWLCHTNTQIHYISRDPEKHREEYSKGYANLRIYRVKAEEATQKLRAEYEEKLEALRGEMEDRISLLAAMLNALMEKRGFTAADLAQKLEERFRKKADFDKNAEQTT